MVCCDAAVSTAGENIDRFVVDDALLVGCGCSRGNTFMLTSAGSVQTVEWYLTPVNKQHMKKPVSPAAHGIMDYVISGVEMAAAPLLGLNAKAARTYQVIGAGYTLINALTRTPVGLKKMIPLKTHQKGDIGLLAGLALLSFVPFIRRDRKAMLFHAGVLALITLQYALTDYNAENR